jgi:hypothetical protein
VSLCRLMQFDFTHGTGRYDERGNELYSDNDLRFGIAYATDYLAEGITRDEFGGFDFEPFRRWCLSKFEAA